MCWTTSASTQHKPLTRICTKLDEFKTGSVSVQDASAQLAAIILNPQDNEKCLMPVHLGGKTGHSWTQPECSTGCFRGSKSGKKFTQNLERLKPANVPSLQMLHNQVNGFNGDKYNKDTVDAPCSASGIVHVNRILNFKEVQDLENYSYQNKLYDEMAK